MATLVPEGRHPVGESNRDSGSRETRWSFDLSVQEAEGRKSVLFQSFTMSHCQPSPKCAERRGCSQVLDFLQVTEVWWGHSRLGHDSAGIALRSLQWPEWECCS